MSFSYPLTTPSTPYYTGAVAAGPAPPASVSLDGVSYPIDLKTYRHNGLEAFREGVTQSAEPSDILFDSQGAWWRYRFSWHHGAGQRVADLDDTADSARYYTSRGIDPWTRYQACLLPDTELVLAVADTEIFMTATATHVYVSDGQSVKRSSNLTAWTAITGLAAEDVVAITTDGTDAYIATTANIYVVGVGSAAATEVTTDTPTNAYTNLAFVANRLLVGDGAILAEVGATTLDTIFTHYQAAFVWSTLFQVGSRIYVGGYSGNRSELYSLTTLEDGALAISTEATSFFAGELLRNALSYGGSVILATSKGVRFATLGADGTLQYGPLIELAGDCRALAAEGRFAWFGIQDFPDSGCGVGRLALDTFVETLQPAYATDVFTTDEDDPIMAAIRFGGRILFAVSGEGVYASMVATYVDEGYIDTGEIYFGTVEDKSISELRVRVSPLQDGESVAVTLVNGETDEALGTGDNSTLGEVGVAVNADGEVANRLTARITLRGDGTSPTCLRQWRSRAYPIAPGTQEWIVPLYIHTRVVMSTGQGQHHSFDVHAEVQRLKEKWEAKEIVMFQEGNHAHRVRISNFEWKPAKWRDDWDWYEGILTLRLLSA